MAHRRIDRVQQTTYTTGVGGLVFDGPTPPRMRTFFDTMSNGDTCWVLIEHQSAAEWELSLATYSGGAITRSFAAGSSSSTGNLVSFSGGLKTVSLVFPAQMPVVQDPNGDIAITRFIYLGGKASSVATTDSSYFEARNNASPNGIIFGVSSVGIGLIYMRDNAAVAIGANNAEVARFVPGVGLGIKKVPDAALDVEGIATLHADTQGILFLDRLNASNGKLAVAFQRQGGTKWEVGVDLSGTAAQDFFIYDGVANAVRFYIDSSGHWLPGADNTQNIGNGSRRVKEGFFANPVLNTSDQREKQDIRALDAAELRVAKALVALVRIFRWKAAVAEKGDAARLHAGWIAQMVVAAFEAEGLDAFKYGCVGFDLLTKQEVFTEQGTREKKRDVEDIERVVEIVDGQPVEVAKTVTRQVPDGVMMPVVDEQGQPVMIQPPTHRDGEGNEVTPAPIPRMHFVPTMETYPYTVEREVPDIDPDTGEQRKRYNVRPTQIMAFIFAGLGDRLATLETP